MKIGFAVILLLLAVSAFAQDPSGLEAAQAGCGPHNVEFRIKIDNSQHPAGQPDAGKAVVYVALDQKFQAVRAVTARVGMDGAWVGANRGNSYLFFTAAPGEHHLCTDWISDLLPGGRLVSVANFTAAAGKVYYFRVRTSGGPSSYLKDSGRSASIDLDPVSSDEGKLLVASSAWSNSEPKRQQASK